MTWAGGDVDMWGGREVRSCVPYVGKPFTTNFSQPVRFSSAVFRFNFFFGDARSLNEPTLILSSG